MAFAEVLNWLPLEKEMAPHSSTPVWKIPWMEEPGGLQTMESQGVGHDWTTSLYFSLEEWGAIPWEIHTNTGKENSDHSARLRPVMIHPNELGVGGLVFD